MTLREKHSWEGLDRARRVVGACKVAVARVLITQPCSQPASPLLRLRAGLSAMRGDKCTCLKAISNRNF